MNKEVKEIIDDVFTNLDSDCDNAIDVLEIKKEKYKKHPRYNNLLDKILIKEKTFLPIKERQAYDEMMDKYADSINYGISLATDYFNKEMMGECKRVLESLIKSFSNSYLNDEFANVVYFNNEQEEEMYSKINDDDREVIVTKVNKGYVYFMYGRVLLEEKKVKESLLSFDLAKTYTPFLKEAYFFKALLLKVNKKFDEAKEEILSVHKYLYKIEDLSDFYYFVGNYCYKFINKENQFIMYKKSYSLNPNKELYDELVEIKPVDKALEYDEKEFFDLANKENIPTDFDPRMRQYVKE